MLALPTTNAPTANAQSVSSAALPFTVGAYHSLGRNSAPAKPVEPAVCPFVVLIDQREGAPYSFTGLFDDVQISPGRPFEFKNLTADSKQKHKPLFVATKMWHLKTGDYTVEGFQQNGICIERKSKEDLFGTLSGGRERFEKEHERMTEFEFAAVVIECGLDDAMLNPPEWSNLKVESVLGYAVSWPMRYGVPWIWAGSRSAAELYTFKQLEKFWKEKQEGSKKK